MIPTDLLFYLCFKVNYKRSFCVVVPAFCTVFLPYVIMANK